MLNNVSWPDYTAFVAMVLVCYYLFIALRFYPREWKQLVSRTRNRSAGLMAEENKVEVAENAAVQFRTFEPEQYTAEENNPPFPEETDDTFQQVQELTAKIKETIKIAVDKGYIKNEFVFSLTSLLKKYPSFKGSTHVVAINNLIESESGKYGYIQLSAEERVELWNE